MLRTLGLVVISLPVLLLTLELLFLSPRILKRGTLLPLPLPLEAGGKCKIFHNLTSFYTNFDHDATVTLLQPCYKLELWRAISGHNYLQGLIFWGLSTSLSTDLQRITVHLFHFHPLVSACVPEMGNGN